VGPTAITVGGVSPPAKKNGERKKNWAGRQPSAWCSLLTAEKKVSANQEQLRVADLDAEGWKTQDSNPPIS